MNTELIRKFRPLTAEVRGTVKRLILTAALPAWFAFGAAPAFAIPAAGGNDTNANIGVGACTTLNFQPVTVVGNQVRYCVATGSADVLNPGQGGGLYAFNLTLDNVVCAPLNGGKERTVEFANAPVQDNRIKEVTSTGFFKIFGAGVHMIRWTARPLPGSPATIVDDRSLSVVCTDVQLPD